MTRGGRPYGVSRIPVRGGVFRSRRKGGAYRPQKARSSRICRWTNQRRVRPARDHGAAAVAQSAPNFTDQDLPGWTTPEARSRSYQGGQPQRGAISKPTSYGAVRTRAAARTTAIVIAFGPTQTATPAAALKHQVDGYCAKRHAPIALCGRSISTRPAFFGSAYRAVRRLVARRRWRLDRLRAVEWRIAMVSCRGVRSLPPPTALTSPVLAPHRSSARAKSPGRSTASLRPSHQPHEGRCPRSTPRSTGYTGATFRMTKFNPTGGNRPTPSRGHAPREPDDFEIGGAQRRQNDRGGHHDDRHRG